MIIKANEGQVSYGESIGILLLDTFTPFIPGDVGNATSYSFPVRFETIRGFTFDKLLHKDLTMLDRIIDAGHNLVREGVKAITGDCGYLAMYQGIIANELKVPVFMSTLLQIPFIETMLGEGEKIGIICSKAAFLDDNLLKSVGINSKASLCVRGMEDKENFVNAAHKEVGILDPNLIEQEVVSVAQEMVKDDPNVKVILLECSSLPPYADSVQRAVNLPVFDYITMINYVQSALVTKKYTGFM